MLPALREELSLHRAAPAPDGAPAWSLYDPVRNQFFRIDWLSFEILKRWALGSPEAIVEHLDASTTLGADGEDVESVSLFLHQNQLLRPAGAEATERLLAVDAQTRQSWWHWMLHRYLFFRVPLWKPDRWLAKNSERVGVLYTRGFLLVSAIALLVALVLLTREWTEFRATLVDVFQPESLMFFLVTLAFVKWLHELGHAFTAKRFGCHVPTMGVAFLVLFPLAYTDVNDAWRLQRRRQRLLVGASGIIVELLLAVWATLAWFLVPDGLGRDALFLVATTTWISTLLVNLSPFLRFDGYFLLMDALELPNLHQRSFALGSWQLRRWLFDTQEPVPEHFPPRRHAALVALAICTWVYRAIVFTGIALLVYTLFPKPLGPALAALELVWFLGIPLQRELSRWPAELRASWGRAAGRRWLWLSVLLVLLLAFPWSSRIATQGLLQPAEFLRVTAPGDGVVEFAVTDGAELLAGTTVARLGVPVLEAEQVRAQVRENTARWRAEVSVFDRELLEQREVFLADSARSRAERQGLDGQLLRYRMDSDIAGTFYKTDIELRNGSWVASGASLGVVADTNVWQVETYVEESALRRIETGDRARFYPETAGLAPLTLELTLIEPDASRQLSDPMLSSAHGGQLLVRSTEAALVPERALYRVILRAATPLPNWLDTRPQIQRGRVVIFGARQAPIAEFFRSAAAVVVREAGL